MKPYLPYILLLSLLALIVGCTTQAEPGAEPPRSELKTYVSVEVAEVLPASQALPLRTSGIVAASEEIRLGFKIGGIIGAVYAQEGAYVKKGQLLARLDPREIDAQVVQAKANVEKLTRDLERTQRLYTDSVATLENVQDLETALEVAKAGLEQASFNQTYAEIYAPSQGRITGRFAEKGEVVGPGNPILVLAAEDKAQVIRVGLADVQVVKVKLGDPASVTFPAFPGAQFKAQVSEIGATANPQTGTYQVELRLAPHSESLKNGFIGQVTLFPSVKSNQVRIPIEALVEADAQSAIIYALDPGDSTVKQVKAQNYVIGNDFLMLPADALQGIESVVTEGARQLSPDSYIQVVTNPNTAILR